MKSVQFKNVAGAAAVAFCANAAMASEFGDFTTFATQQLKNGARGLLVGEEHNSVGLPRLVSKNAKALKQQANISTLYVEYYSGNQQAQLDKALAGNPIAQRELYADFASRASSAAGTQARYDLMFTAKQSGMRVKAFDTSVGSFPIYLSSAGDITQMRMTIGDAYMAQTIRKNDDGKPFIAIMGDLHNALKPEDSRITDATLLPEKSAYDEPSPHAGVPQRLSAAGISTAVLSLSDVPASNGRLTIWPVQKMLRNLNGAAQVTGVHELILPDEPERLVPPNQFARAHGTLRFLNELLEPVHSPAKNKLQASSLKLSNAFLGCAAVPVLRYAAQNYLRQLGVLERTGVLKHEPARAAITETVEAKFRREMAAPTFVADQKKLCSKAGEKLWRRPVP